jgi:hypothetical protein
MRHNKCAVFQATNNQGMARLICVHGIDFKDGATLEAEMQSICGAWLHVTFLGRFDQVESATDLAQAFALLFAGPAPRPRLQEINLPRA